MCSRMFKVPSSCNPFFHSLDRSRNSLPDNNLESSYYQSCLSQDDIESLVEVIPIAQEKSSICPKCGFTVRGTSVSIGKRRKASILPRSEFGLPSLPAVVDSAILLDSSPTPQFLLSNDNTVVYANKSATNLLGRTIVVGDDDFKSSSPPLGSPPSSPPGRGPVAKKRSSWTSADSRYISASLKHDAEIEGLNLKDLPIELAPAEMSRWITLDQLLKNVKNAMQTHHEQGAYGYDSNAYSEFYDTGKDDDDYYESKEARGGSNGKKLEGSARKEKIPVIITKKDGELLGASLYLSRIESSAAGVKDYLALSIVPNSDDVDAGFNPISRNATTRTRRAKPLSKDAAVKTTGVDVVERIAKLKDMILDEMDFPFTCITPDGDIVITNKACRELLGEEALKSPVGYVIYYLPAFFLFDF